jgi:hypothetical protein
MGTEHLVGGGPEPPITTGGSERQDYGPDAGESLPAIHTSRKTVADRRTT